MLKHWLPLFLAALTLSGSARAASAQNAPPVLDPIGNKTVNEGSLLNFTATASDFTGSTLVFSLAPPIPQGAAIDGATGVFTWTPTEAQGPGMYPATVRVTRASDGASDEETISVTVNEVNLAPVLSPIANKSICEGVLLQFTAAATDADVPANTLTFSVSAGNPAGSAITAGGAFTWTPTEAQGPGVFPITLCVTDDGTLPLQDCETFSVTVLECDTGPVLGPIGNKTVNEGSALTFTATATDADIPPQALAFSLTLGSPPATGAVINASTGAFMWTPTEAHGPNVYPITVNVSDGSLTDTELIHVTVNEVNVAPILASIGNKVVNEGSLLSFTATATDADVPANVLTFSLTLGTPEATGATINPSTGAFSWVPTSTQGGVTYPITINVTDNGVPPLRDSEAIQVFVGVSCFPVILSAIGNRTVNETHLLTFTATATDPNFPSSLTFSLGAGAPIGAAITAGGIFTWTPAEAQGPGVYPVTIIATVGGSCPSSDSETIQITVNEENVQPVIATIGDKTADEGQLLTFTVTATDADQPSNILTFTLEGAPIGATIQPSTGVFTWTPAEDQGPNIYAITVRVTDSEGLSDAETIQVTILEENSGPTADAGGPYQGVVGVAVNFDGSGSHDPDGDPLTFAWDFGDGSGSTAMNPVHVFVASSVYTVGLLVSDPAGLFDDASTTASIDAFFTTEVFFTGGNKTTRLASGKASTCAQLEPVNNAYNSTDVDLGSIRMAYGGSSIPAISGKTAIDADRDHDGLMEITACFSKENLRILFADLPPGDNLVDVAIEGTLLNGASFHGTAVHQVIASGGGLAASVSPNPLNPEATATFRTSMEGMVRVQLFDLQGRLIRTLMEERTASAGYHEVTIDGRDAAGHKLASGVYYLRIHSSVDGTETRAIAILK